MRNRQSLGVEAYNSYLMRQRSLLFLLSCTFVLSASAREPRFRHLGSRRGARAATPPLMMMMTSVAD